MWSSSCGPGGVPWAGSSISSAIGAQSMSPFEPRRLYLVPASLEISCRVGITTETARRESHTSFGTVSDWSPTVSHR